MAFLQLNLEMVKLLHLQLLENLHSIPIDLQLYEATRTKSHNLKCTLFLIDYKDSIGSNRHAFFHFLKTNILANKLFVSLITQLL